MKFDIIVYLPPFYLAVRKGNIEIARLLLENNKLDVNLPYI